MKRAFVVPLLVILLVSAVYAYPQPVGYVNDFANILPNAAVLENDLRSYEQNTTIEIAIVTISALPADETMYTYATGIFNDWGVGKKGQDNGILILIINNGTAGSRMKIELGYGIQGYITGAEAGRILDAAIPYYTQDDYGAAAQVAVDGLKSDLANYAPGQPPQRNPIEMLAMPMAFLLSIAVMIVFLSVFRTVVDTEQQKKLVLAEIILLPILGVIGLLIFAPLMIGVFVFGLISVIGIGAYFVRSKCPKCGSRGVKYTYVPNSPTVICQCKKCGKKWKKQRQGRYVNGVFVAWGAGGLGGGMGGGGGFGGGGSGGGGAGR